MSVIIRRELRGWERAAVGAGYMYLYCADDHSTEWVARRGRAARLTDGPDADRLASRVGGTVVPA